MADRDIVVIGGSAGSIGAIEEIVQSLPPDLDAAIFVVIHLSPRGRSYLPQILDRRCSLPVTAAQDGDRIEPGHVYVAPPDRHLLIAQDHIHLTRGPKEGLHRPSINVTFRSAGMTYGSRVIGILLSGLLDDGAAGLWEIAQDGGITIVQDPDEAPFPSMPLNAIQDAGIDYCLMAAEIGGVVGDLVKGSEPQRGRAPAIETAAEQFSGFTCPECRGPMYTRESAGPLEFRCRVGHTMSLQTLLEEATSTQERKLYEALVALEEGADMADTSARKLTGIEGDRFREEATQLRRQAVTLREIIETRVTPSLK
ncbi:MAG TPA: chemotaxis protein CheB [Terracidiphilus sp.]|jgi:two-component system chemotaxis response regulator CheB|nr:chemotaxis protein CheB [Terracidiphilus sp.]